MAVAVLNRAEGFKVAFDVASGNSVEIPIHPAGTKGTVGRLEVAEVSPNNWRLTAESVAALPTIWQNIRDEVPVNGFPTDFEGNLDTAQQLRNRMSRHLWHEFLGVEIWQWISFAVLFAASWTFSRILRSLISLPLRKRLGEKGASSLDRLKSGISWGVGGGVWFSALPYLDLPIALAVPFTIASKTVIGVGAVKAGISVVDLSTNLAGERTKGVVKRADSIYLPILRNFARFVVILIVLWIFLASLDVNVTGLIAGLGIGGLVLALAAKDSVENIFGSLTILFDMPFGIGDWVKIGNDVNGIVEEINLRSTRIRTFDDSVITVPNSNLTKAAVENFGLRRQRRINFTLSLSRTDPIAALQFADKLKEAMRQHPKIRPDNAYAYITALTETGVTVLVQGYILTSDYEEELSVRQELVEIIAVIAAESGVEFAPIHWAVPPPVRKA